MLYPSKSLAGFMDLYCIRLAGVDIPQDSGAQVIKFFHCFKEINIDSCQRSDIFDRHLRIQTEAEKSDYQLNLRLPRPDFAKDSSPEEQNGEPGLPQASSRVVRRWLSIFDCALFFSSLSQSEPPAASSQLDQLEPDTPGDDNSDTTEVINILKFRSHMTKRGSPKNKSPTVTVLIGSRTACQEDLLVPLRLVDMALKLDMDKMSPYVGNSGDLDRPGFLVYEDGSAVVTKRLHSGGSNVSRF
ncbi:unnamed protein product [Schistocephalus solidus]|uniref:Rab3 GTPase-activating protein catalytic subunit n=1 Tax=Schistocephalus solidus TaxID=70667 RepID=A0A183SMV4_SCHSO|nr:unnamed protein product [Schistocephalus solidus]